MVDERNEPHFETDSARGGSTPHIVRWILAISLLAAIVLLSIIWMTGAATQGDAEEHVEVTRRIQDTQDNAAAGDSTDSIVSDGADEIQGTAETTGDPAAADADPARTVANQN